LLLQLLPPPSLDARFSLCSTSFNAMNNSGPNAIPCPALCMAPFIPAIRITSSNMRAGI
jgi:hypothetical protein